MTISFMQISVTVQANRFPTVAGTDIGDDSILQRTVGRDDIGFAQVQQQMIAIVTFAI